MRDNIISICSLALLAMTCGCARQAEEDPRRTPVVAAVEKAMPSVANIGTERIVRTMYDDPLQRMREQLREQLSSDFFGRPPPSEYKLAHSLGSGVVIHPDGYILTNYHVIDKASTIYVSLGDISKCEAELLAGDPISDLALIRIDVDRKLAPIEFARDDDLMLGEQVIVLGNPYGLSQTVTVGVLSSKEREARYNGELIFKDILQTDAAVNPGSSGGPLLNIRGELIGVNIAVYKDAQNIGFAVPVKRVRQLLEHWLSPEFLCRRTLGLAIEEDEQGLRVARVFEDGPAASKSLQPGDRVRSVNGVPVEDLFAFRKILLGPALNNEKVELGIAAGTLPRVVELDWIDLPRPSGAKLARARLGLQLETAKSGDGTRIEKGLEISDVLANSPAAEIGLYPGLKLIAIAGQPVQSLEAVGELLENVAAGDKVQLTLAEVKEQGPIRMMRQIGVELEAE